MSIEYVGKLRAMIRAYRLKPGSDPIKAVDPGSTAIFFHKRCQLEGGAEEIQRRAQSVSLLQFIPCFT